MTDQTRFARAKVIFGKDDVSDAADKPTIRQGRDGQWYYQSSDPFIDGQPVGHIRPQWVEEAIAKAEAEKSA